MSNAELCAVCGHPKTDHDYGDGSSDFAKCTVYRCRCEDWQEALEAFGDQLPGYRQGPWNRE